MESIRLDNILNSNEYFLHFEEENKSVFNNLDYNVLKINLIAWIAKGYPDAHAVFTFPVTGLKENGLYKCSDSTSRNLEDYVPFFLQMPLLDLISNYQAKIGGMTLSYSIGADSVELLVTKPSE
jgi:hypothetical protein